MTIIKLFKNQCPSAHLHNLLNSNNILMHIFSSHDQLMKSISHDSLSINTSKNNQTQRLESWTQSSSHILLANEHITTFLHTFHQMIQILLLSIYQHITAYKTSQFRSMFFWDAKKWSSSKIEVPQDKKLISKRLLSKFFIIKSVILTHQSGSSRFSPSTGSHWVDVRCTGR